MRLVFTAMGLSYKLKKQKLQDQFSQLDQNNATYYYNAASCCKWVDLLCVPLLAVCVQLWLIFTHLLLFVVDHYTLPPNWPSSRVQQNAFTQKKSEQHYSRSADAFTTITCTPDSGKLG
jgi:hypothetical protein